MIPPTMVFVSQAILRRVRAATSARFRGFAAGALVLALVACADAPDSGEMGAASEGPDWAFSPDRPAGRRRDGGGWLGVDKAGGLGLDYRACGYDGAGYGAPPPDGGHWASGRRLADPYDPRRSHPYGSGADRIRTHRPRGWCAHGDRRGGRWVAHPPDSHGGRHLTLRRQLAEAIKKRGGRRRPPPRSFRWV